jgi:2'-5' RNA ligase
MFPFVEGAHDVSTSFDGTLLEAIRAALAEQTPFEISLDRFGNFNSTLVYLEPDATAASAIQRLGRTLDTTFKTNGNTELILKQKRSSGLVTPHMTVGQWSKSQSAAAVASIESDWQPIRWRVDHVCIVSRTGQDSPMEVRHRIPLSGKTAASSNSNGGAEIDTCATRPSEQLVLRGFQLSSTHSVLTVSGSPASAAAGSKQPESTDRQARAMHFCLDNSASMGSNAETAKRKFAQLLEIATEPSSLTIFDGSATTLDSNLTTTAQMVATVRRLAAFAAFAQPEPWTEQLLIDDFQL